MANGWLGLNTALSGLRTAQEMLDISAHNVANASTPGYSRQRANLVAAPPFSLPAFNRSGLPGQLGTGVMVSSVTRIRDLFLDQQVSAQAAIGGYWSARSDILSSVEASFPEPSGSGMGNELSAFWSAWEDLAANPSSTAARTQVLSQASSLAARFNRDSGQITAQATAVDSQVRATIADINDIGSQIASLNKQIQAIVISGDHANDLEDQRDALLQRLNELVPASSQRLADGTVTVMIDGTALVDHDQARAMNAVNNAAGHAIPTWATGDPVSLQGGRLKGLVELRDTTLAGYQTSMSTLAKQLADQVNALTTSGVDAAGNPGLALFTYTAGSEAATLAINPAVGTDPSKVVVAKTAGAPGDTSIAAAIADLRLSGTFGTGAQTPGDAYASFIGTIGADSRQAAGMSSNQTLVVQQLETRRESVSGVSLDEEATDVMKFQKAYSASARVITAIDEMLDTLINKTGLVGR